MQSFTFITDTDGGSGKIASQKTRTLIRAHVMRKHWTEKTPAAEEHTSNENFPQLEQSDDIRSPGSAVRNQGPIYDDSLSSRRLASDSFEAEESISQDMILSRHLNRVTDGFIYGGSKIDFQSYGYFHHYSMEFSIILPNSIQPLPLRKTSASSLAAIQQNSPTLLITICFMAVFHECMKRTKDSWGRLITTFSDEIVLRYKTAAIERLSKKLSNDPNGPVVTEADILCVTILLFSETIAGDRQAIDSHLLGLTRMIELHGGQESLSPIVVTNLQFATLLAAQLDHTKPILAIQPCMQDRFDRVSAAPLPPTTSYCETNGMESPLFSPPLCLEWSESLHQCLRYMYQVIRRIERAQHSVKVIDGEWMDDVLTLEYVLVSLPHGQPPLSQLEECVRLAALVYCNTALWKIPLYFRWVMALVVNLKSALISLDDTHTGWTDPGLRFWMLFMGRQACTLEFSALETMWWNSAIQQVATELGVVTWEEARQILQGYFFTDGATRWEAVWTDVIQGARSAEPLRDPQHPCDYI